MKQLLQRYAQLVSEHPRGLFSARDTELLADHIQDGLAGSAALDLPPDPVVVDLGSGGGIPAIPLAIARPDAEVHCVESIGWKAEFLEAAAVSLGLESRLRVHASRIEELPAESGRGWADLGIARAVAPPPVVAEYLAPLLRVGGQVAMWTTRSHAGALPKSVTAALGLGPASVVPIPSPLRSDGILLVARQEAPCPERFPRRVGVAARRPLA